MPWLGRDRRLCWGFVFRCWFGNANIFEKGLSVCLLKTSRNESLLHGAVCVLSSGWLLPVLGHQSKCLWPSYENTQRLNPLLSRWGLNSSSDPFGVPVPQYCLPSNPTSPFFTSWFCIFLCSTQLLGLLSHLLISFPFWRSDRVPQAAHRGADRPAVHSGGSRVRSLSHLPLSIPSLLDACLSQLINDASTRRAVGLLETTSVLPCDAVTSVPPLPLLRALGPR